MTNTTNSGSTAIENPKETELPGVTGGEESLARVSSREWVTVKVQKDWKAKTPIGKKTSVALAWLKKKGARELGLNLDEQCVLLGGIPKRTLTTKINQASKNEPVDVSRDVYDRLSLIIGIYGNLVMIAPEGDARGMFSRPSDLWPLMGKSIRDYLLEDGSMESLLTIRRWLDGQRG